MVCPCSCSPSIRKGLVIRLYELTNIILINKIEPKLRTCIFQPLKQQLDLHREYFQKSNFRVGKCSGWVQIRIEARFIGSSAQHQEPKGHQELSSDGQLGAWRPRRESDPMRLRNSPWNTKIIRSPWLALRVCGSNPELRKKQTESPACSNYGLLIKGPSTRASTGASPRSDGQCRT